MRCNSTSNPHKAIALIANKANRNNKGIVLRGNARKANSSNNVLSDVMSVKITDAPKAKVKTKDKPKVRDNINTRIALKGRNNSLNSLNSPNNIAAPSTNGLNPSNIIPDRKCRQRQSRNKYHRLQSPRLSRPSPLWSLLVPKPSRLHLR